MAWTLAFSRTLITFGDGRIFEINIRGEDKPGVIRVNGEPVDLTDPLNPWIEVLGQRGLLARNGQHLGIVEFRMQPVEPSPLRPCGCPVDPAG